VVANDAARLRVSIQPESATFTSKSGAGPIPSPSTVGRQKRALRSNFQFEISGLARASSLATEVSSIVIRRLAGAPDGSSPSDPAGVLDISNVTIKIPESGSADFLGWIDEFVVRADSGAATERSAILTFLDQGRRNVIARVDLAGVGIFRIARQRASSSVLGSSQLSVEMYCEAVRLSWI